MSHKDELLYERIHPYALALWTTRHHDDVLEDWMRVQHLKRINGFEQMFPKEAVEISNEIGWPDDKNSVRSNPGHTDVAFVPDNDD